MTVKKCTCGKDLKTRDVTSLGIVDGVLYLNCKACKTTLVILSKQMKKLVYGEAA